ncbi:MAG: hypothetical protein QOJ15_11074 [Bradyrhizobium sp.]|nr:hypothetical protein [Bradyrhizobium sp.]
MRSGWRCGEGKRDRMAMNENRPPVDSARKGELDRAAGWPSLSIRNALSAGIGAPPHHCWAGRSEYHEARARAPSGAASPWR